MNSPLLPETLVNSITVGNQSNPKVATLLDGSYVIVWESAGQDGSGSSVVAQRFTAAGERIGNEFLVNSNQTGDQRDVSVTGTDDGGFVIVWEGVNQDDPGSFDTGIFGQRYDASGLPAGEEFQVNAVNVDFR